VSGALERLALPFDPATASLTQLRADLDEIRLIKGRGSGYGATAYNRLNRASHAQGRPLSQLRRDSQDESERFFARVVTGPDGHAYWNNGPRGGKNFTGNGSRWYVPARWWWQHVHGPIGTTTLRLYPTCSDGACINPEHQELRHFREGTGYTHDQIIGAIQTMAIRLGRPPTTRQWIRHGGKPDKGVLIKRFGSWPRAMWAAGFDYRDRRATR
jgi:hypothetical protein